MANITVTDEDVMIYNQKTEKQVKIIEQDTSSKNNSFTYVLLESIEKIKTSNKWVGSKNEKIKSLGNSDAVGKVGELMVESIVKNYPKMFTVEYDGDRNTNKGDGIYDMKIHSLLIPTIQFNTTIRTEIKTATVGTNNNTFQYETFKENVCDKYILMSITPNEIFMTSINPSELYPIKTHEVFNTKLCIRKRTDVGKLTFSLSSLYKGVRFGNTIEIYNSTDAQIKRFLEKHLIING